MAARVFLVRGSCSRPRVPSCVCALSAIRSTLLQLHLCRRSARFLVGSGSDRAFPVVLDDLQVRFQLLVEAVLVGLFGICGPYFLHKKGNRPLDCVSDENQDFLFPQYYLPTAMVRGP